MSDGIQLFIIFIFVIVMFSILNFLALSLSQHNFKRRIVAGFTFLLLTPIVFLTTLTFAPIFNKDGFGSATLAFIVASIYISNGIIILISSTFIPKKT
ncbi:hypothetical protein CN907_11970 [Bacillus anthracis]|uniref:YesK-like protein n=1 Tax=Bacillus fungorum TaxID=2039284 RepID=A0A2G6QHV9_9BACI|nr:hypothetical protein [Bacillus fungorum]PGK40060.1 hypothetical protein CN907_11970 [Bacillus anthracis]PIE96361.1 hypothetical protein CO726_06425 [Bacillus fungorum]